MSKTPNAMTPLTIDTFKVSAAPTTAKAAKAAAAESLLTVLVMVRGQGDGLQDLRAKLALAVWNLRLCFFFTGADKVRRPDYNGKSSDYQDAYRALMVKAGFAITETMTPYEAHSMEVAKRQVAAAIRYEVRKLADRALTADQLRAAGFSWTSALGDAQKLSENDKPLPKAPKLMSVSVAISNAITELDSAIARPQDVRDLLDTERADLLQKLTKAASAVALLLGAKPPVRVVRKAAPSPRPRKEVKAPTSA